MDRKRVEVEALRVRGGMPVEGSVPPPRPFENALRRDGHVVLMAELKRRSPGAGAIRPGLDPPVVANAYEEAGAGAVSVLTDSGFFGGSLDDLRAVRERVSIPVLRKDFIVDEAQIDEARRAGADGILLIARILPGARLHELARFARERSMPALVEVHDRTELDRALDAGAEVIGINNRDLSTFRTDVSVTLDLAPHVPPSVILVSESGIRGGQDVVRLGAAGVDAVLVGEWLLRADDPARAARELVGHEKVTRG